MCGVVMLGGSRDEQDPNLASAQKVHSPVGEVRPSSRSKDEHLFTFTRTPQSTKLRVHVSALLPERLSEVGKADTLTAIVQMSRCKPRLKGRAYRLSWI